MESKLSRRTLMIAGAAAVASPALAQPAPGGPAPGGPPAGPPGGPPAGPPPMRPPVAGPQVAPPAEPLGAPFPVVGSVEQFDASLANLIDVSTPVEKVLGGFVWIEGPVWIGGKDDGYMLCSDPRANRIIKWTPPKGQAKAGGEVWKAPSGYEGPNNQGWAPNLQEPGTNGLIRARGGLLGADQGNRAIAFFDLRTRAKTILVSRFEGKRFNSPNDMVLHPSGAVFFTDPPFGLNNVFNSPDREMDYTGVFRLNPDNTVTLIDRTLRPNGIGLSPDGSKLYATDSSGWVVFDVDARGNASNRKVFIERSVVAGGDGLKIDHLGNMWASSAGGLSIFNPQGKRIGLIKADERISNCEIGEDGYVYMTSNTRLIRAKVKVKKIARANA